MKDNTHLPILGPGPLYGTVVITLTVVASFLRRRDILPSAPLPWPEHVSLTLGVLLIAFAVVLWIAAVVLGNISEHIKKNHLLTTGAYALVRNPIYSAIMIACTGIILIQHHLWLLILPLFFWGLLTILMICTEERWLAERFGDEYRAYCQRTNRCIPWFPRRVRK